MVPLVGGVASFGVPRGEFVKDYVFGVGVCDGHTVDDAVVCADVEAFVSLCLEGVQSVLDEEEELLW